MKAAKLRKIAVDNLKQRLGPTIGTPKKITKALKKYTEKDVSLLTLSFYESNDIDIFANEIRPQII
jgi:hypothetical protein